MRYADYLKSDRWKELWAERMALDKGICALCVKKAEQVHHRRYPKVLGEETADDLISLCGDCHDRHHEVLVVPQPLVEFTFRCDLCNVEYEFDDMHHGRAGGEKNHYRGSICEVCWRQG